MENYYVITGRKNWADEFDVFFFEIFDEDAYQKYMAAKEILGTLSGDYGFGTNEGWDGFNYLSFKPKKITEEQSNFLDELNIWGKDIIEPLYIRLNDLCSDIGIDIDVYEASLDEFKEALMKLKSSRD